MILDFDSQFLFDNVLISSFSIQTISQLQVRFNLLLPASTLQVRRKLCQDRLPVRALGAIGRSTKTDPDGAANFNGQTDPDDPSGQAEAAVHHPEDTAVHQEDVNALVQLFHLFGFLLGGLFNCLFRFLFGGLFDCLFGFLFRRLFLPPVPPACPAAYLATVRLDF